MKELLNKNNHLLLTNIGIKKMGKRDNVKVKITDIKLLQKLNEAKNMLMTVNMCPKIKRMDKDHKFNM